MTKSNVVDKNSAVELFRSSKGEYLMSKALFYGVQEISERPKREQERSNMDDMKYIYNKIFPIFKNVNFTLGKGGEEDSFEKAIEFANNPRGTYIRSQALYLAIKYLKAKRDKTDNIDIQDMGKLLNGVFSGAKATFELSDLMKDFHRNNKALCESGDLTLISKKMTEYLKLNGFPIADAEDAAAM